MGNIQCGTWSINSSFSKEVKLKKGLNRIRIRASDLLGKITEKEIEVFGDFEGPVVNVSNFVDGQEVGENRVVLTGALADATGITTTFETTPIQLSLLAATDLTASLMTTTESQD